MKVLFKFFVLIFILIIGFAGLGIYWTFYKPLPDYGSTLQLSSLNNPVDVHWDPYGVPYIYAQNEQDLYFTAGYIHAQERIWQMTLSQISMEGRFAEFFGEELTDLDKFQRTIGFWQTAKNIEQEMPEHILDLLQIYADGVNEFVDHNRKHLPIEFSLLSVEPIEWTPVHTIAMARLMAWDQNIHWWNEITYGVLEGRLDQNRLRELFPVYSDDYPTTMNDSQSSQIAEAASNFLDTDFKRRKLSGIDGPGFGSNAWAVQGSKTESGSPMLSGDPHMGLSMPGFWFEVHYSTPEYRLTGATIPGVPSVIMGQNDHIAWTITNMMADVLDFYVEQESTDNRDYYVTDSLAVPVQTEPFEYRDEIIKVKDGDDISYRIRHTQNGPVISDLYSDSDLLDERLLSMRWAGNEISLEGLAIYMMNHAQTIEEFEAAVENFKAPAMNFTYADRDDNIAIFSGGNIPIRDHHPLLFKQGWNPEHRWQGMIPFNDLPRLVNPPEAFVAHANNKLHTDAYPYHIGSFWAPPSRIMQINQQLTITDSLTVQSMQNLQLNNFSEHAREITEDILPVLRSGPQDFSTILPYLENWDFTYSLNSTAASIFDLFFLKLAENTLIDDIGETSFRHLSALDYVPIHIMKRFIIEDSAYFNDVETDRTETRSDMIRLSMQQTVDELTERFGDEPINWRWENVNTITLKPALLGEAAQSPEAPGAFRMIVNNLFTKGPYPREGHPMSVNKSGYQWENPFDVVVGPSIRRIIDFSDTGRSYSILPTGQSGNPISAHYGDQTDMWLNGNYKFIYQDSTFFQQTSYQTMTLTPE